MDLPGVRVCGQHPPDHEELVEVEEGGVLPDQQLYIVGVDLLAALRTLQVRPTLLDLDPAQTIFVDFEEKRIDLSDICRF